MQPPYLYPLPPRHPWKEAETSVGDGTHFSFELHRSKVLSKRSQVQIFFLDVRKKGREFREREKGTGERVKEGEEEI